MAKDYLLAPDILTSPMYSELARKYIDVYIIQSTDNTTKVVYIFMISK